MKLPVPQMPLGGPGARTEYVSAPHCYQGVPQCPGRIPADGQRRGGESWAQQPHRRAGEKTVRSLVVVLGLTWYVTGLTSPLPHPIHVGPCILPVPPCNCHRDFPCMSQEHSGQQGLSSASRRPSCSSWERSSWDSACVTD